jgi:hypothetical protein
MIRMKFTHTFWMNPKKSSLHPDPSLEEYTSYSKSQQIIFIIFVAFFALSQIFKLIRKRDFASVNPLQFARRYFNSHEIKINKFISSHLNSMQIIRIFTTHPQIVKTNQLRASAFNRNNRSFYLASNT